MDSESEERGREREREEAHMQYIQASVSFGRQGCRSGEEKGDGWGSDGMGVMGWMRGPEGRAVGKEGKRW